MASYTFTSCWGDDDHADVLLHLDLYTIEEPDTAAATPVLEPAKAAHTAACSVGKGHSGCGEAVCAHRELDMADSLGVQPGQPHQAEQADQRERHAKTFRLHAVILSAASAYFKAQLSKAWQSQASGAAVSGANSSSSSRPGSFQHELVEHVEGEGEVQAWEHLLRLMYGTQLPTNSSAQLLMQCLRLADRLQAVQCMDLLLPQLVAMVDDKAGSDFVVQALAMPPGAFSRPAAKPLFEACNNIVQRLFGDVPAVLNDKALRDQFCKLPFTAVLAWAESDNLQVHSENCVVCLLTAWANGPQAGGEERASAEQLEQLAHQVRVLHLGPVYQHHALPNLWWFKDCSSMAHLPTLLMYKGVDAQCQLAFPKKELQGKLGWEGASQWVAASRKQCNTAGHLTWQVDAAQLKLLDQGIESDSCQIVNGIPLKLGIRDASCGPNVCAGLFCEVDTEMADSLSIPWSNAAVVIVDFTCKLVGPDAASSKEASILFGALGSRGLGFSSFFARPEPCSSLEQLMAPHLKSGQLHIEAMFRRVDMRA